MFENYFDKDCQFSFLDESLDAGSTSGKCCKDLKMFLVMKEEASERDLLDYENTHETKKEGLIHATSGTT